MDAEKGVYYSPDGRETSSSDSSTGRTRINVTLRRDPNTKKYHLEVIEEDSETGERRVIHHEGDISYHQSAKKRKKDLETLYNPPDSEPPSPVY